MPKKILLNQTQLARFLKCAAATVAKRIAAGELLPVAFDGNGRPLFAQPRPPTTEEVVEKLTT